MLAGSGRRRHAHRISAYLRAQKRPLSAYQILEGLRAEGLVAPTTVYRAPDRLAAAGRVYGTESRNAWTACSGPGDAETPVFEICDDCGAVAERHDARLAREITAFFDLTSFAAERSLTELRVRCGGDRADAPTA